MRHGSLNVDLLPRQTDQRHKSYTLEIVVQIRLHLSCSLLASAIYYSTKNAAAPPSLPLSSFLLRNLDLDSCLLVFGTRSFRRSKRSCDGTLDCGCKMQEERERKRKILTKIIFRQFRNSSGSNRLEIPVATSSMEDDKGCSLSPFTATLDRGRVAMDVNNGAAT